MNLLSPCPFWPIQDGLPASFPCLDADVHADVAVLGGGVSGALAALHLVAAGLDVVLLDRRDVAHGSTAGSTSLLQYEIDEPLHRLAERYDLATAEACYRRCAEAIGSIEALVRRHRIACDLEQKHSLFLASSRAHLPVLRKEYNARRRAGFDVQWWDRGQVEARSSLPSPAAILSRLGAQLDAYRFTYGLLVACRRLGVRIFDRTEVKRTQWTPQGVRLHTPRGRVRAKHLVCATGYEADSLLVRPMTTLRSTFAFVTEPVERLEGWPENGCLIWETSDPYVYLRTTADRRVIIGGADEDFRDPLRRDRLLAAKTRHLQGRLKRWFPALHAPVAYSWAGTFARTEDGLPWIGPHPKNPRLWLALGYGGNGITFSLIAAELVRDGILKRKNDDSRLFGFARLDRRRGRKQMNKI